MDEPDASRDHSASSAALADRPSPFADLPPGDGPPLLTPSDSRRLAWEAAWDNDAGVSMMLPTTMASMAVTMTPMPTILAQPSLVLEPSLEQTLKEEEAAHGGVAVWAQDAWALLTLAVPLAVSRLPRLCGRRQQPHPLAAPPDPRPCLALPAVCQPGSLLHQCRGRVVRGAAGQPAAVCGGACSLGIQRDRWVNLLAPACPPAGGLAVLSSPRHPGSFTQASA